MTTSFAYFARGRLAAAAQAHPGGLALAALCAAQIPWAWISLVRGRWWLVRRMDATVLLWAVAVLSGLLVAGWMVRVLAGG